MNSKVGYMTRRRPEFTPGKAGAEAAKLKKFSDAGGSQIQWLLDAVRNQVLSSFGYMAKDPNQLLFLDAKEDAVENLEAIRNSLVKCIEEGMIDEEDAYYNQLLALEDEAALSENWDELMEVVAKGKTLEIDVSNWLARHGRSHLSLPWPRQAK